MTQRNNPLHGITLQQIIDVLVAEQGWDRMAEQIKINCFISDPSVKSSLKFLRKTPWAREKVEQLYLSTRPTEPVQTFVWPKPQNKPDNH